MQEQEFEGLDEEDDSEGEGDSDGTGETAEQGAAGQEEAGDEHSVSYGNEAVDRLFGIAEGLGRTSQVVRDVLDQIKTRTDKAKQKGKTYKLSKVDIGRLYNAVYEEIGGQIETLMEYAGRRFDDIIGQTDGNLSAEERRGLATAAAKYDMGAELTSEEAEALANSHYGKQQAVKAMTGVDNASGESFADGGKNIKFTFDGKTKVSGEIVRIENKDGKISAVIRYGKGRTTTRSLDLVEMSEATRSLIDATVNMFGAAKDASMGLVNTVLQTYQGGSTLEHVYDAAKEYNAELVDAFDRESGVEGAAESQASVASTEAASPVAAAARAQARTDAAARKAAATSTSRTVTVVENGTEVERTIDSVAVRGGQLEAVVGGRIVETDSMSPALTGLSNYVANYSGSISTDLANAILDSYTGGSMNTHANNVMWAYWQAKAGRTDINGKGRALNKSTIARITEIAKGDSAAADQRAQTEAKNRTLMMDAQGNRRYGVRFAEGSSLASVEMNDNDMAQYEGLNVLANELKHDIVLFDSKTDQNGDYIGENGRFDHNTNTVYIDLNSGYNNKADSLKEGANRAILGTASHEYTHLIRSNSPALYKEMRDMIASHLGGNTLRRMAEHEMSVTEKSEKNRVLRGEKKTAKKLSFEDAEEEVIARTMEGILYDDAAMKRFADRHKSLAQKLVSFLRGFGKRIRAAFKTANISDFVNALMDDNGHYIEQIADKWYDALYAASENMNAAEAAGRMAQDAASAAHPNQLSIRDFTQAAGLVFVETEDGHGFRIEDGHGNEVKHVTAEHIKSTPIGTLVQSGMNKGNINAKQAAKIYDMYAGLMDLIVRYQDQAMVWEIAGNEIFSSIKANSDAQYGTTVDYGTICAKTQAIVDVISETMLRKGRGLTTKEIMAAYGKTHANGLSVPCPVCYVFYRWMGVPGLLNNMQRYQKRFAGYNGTGEWNSSMGMSIEQVRQYTSSVEKRYAKEGKTVNKAISDAKTSTLNKLNTQRSNLAKFLQEHVGQSEDSYKPADKEKLKGIYEAIATLESEYADLEAYAWVTQVYCTKKGGTLSLNKKFKPVPNDILLDLRKGGEFASKHPESWKYRTTRGAGMGKAIQPYSGAKIGDAVKSSNTSGSSLNRWAEGKNPFLQMDQKGADNAITSAMRRAKAQNLIGGQRFQSTSDFRPEWGLDYMMTLLELQAYGSKVQLYTKVIEAVDMLATSNAMVNESIMGRGNGYHLDKNGKPVLGVEDFSSITGIDFQQAYQKTLQYDNVQMILVGMNDPHIQAAMADDRIGFIIPWHSSGNNEETLKGLMHGVNEILQKGTDYTKVQSDIIDPHRSKEQKAAWDLRMKILTGKQGSKAWNGVLTAEEQAILDSNSWLRDLHDRFWVNQDADDTYGVRLKSDQAKHIFPYEYWDTSLTIKDADENGRRFVEYCKTLGMIPRFSGLKLDEGYLVGAGCGNFVNEKGYWKTLIDRRMYDKNGNYYAPKAIDVTGITNGMIPMTAEAKYASKNADGTRRYDANTEQAIRDTMDRIDAMQEKDGANGLREVEENASDEDNRVQYELRDYDKQQIANWANSKRIVLYNGRESLLEFFANSINDKSFDKKMYFGAIGENLAKRIYELTGIDVNGYNLAIGSSEIKKILLNSHGDAAKEELRGQRALTIDDIITAVQLITEPENIWRSKKTRFGSPVILFSKEKDGRMISVTYTSTKHHDLFIQTIYAWDAKEKETLATPEGEKTPSITPEASSGTDLNDSVQ